MGLAPNNTGRMARKRRDKVPLGISLQGRILNGRAVPMDGGGPSILCRKMGTNSRSYNKPWRRRSPHEFIETGISTIDFMNTLVKGQKLPIFTGSGLPANKLAAQIAKYARTFTSSDQCATFPGCVRRYRHNPRGSVFL